MACPYWGLPRSGVRNPRGTLLGPMGMLRNPRYDCGEGRSRGSGDVTWKGRKMNKEWKDATKHADLEKIRWLIENGADINSKDQYGQTALMNAAHRGQVELVRLLIENDADLNITAKYNLSALMLSLIAGHSDVARLLIEAGADVNLRSNMNFYSALHLAENAGYSEIVALLQQKGATA